MALGLIELASRKHLGEGKVEMIEHGQIEIVSFSTIHPQWLGGPSSQLFSVGRIELSDEWKQGMNWIWGSIFMNLRYSM